MRKRRSRAAADSWKVAGGSHKSAVGGKQDSENGKHASRLGLNSRILSRIGNIMLAEFGCIM